LCSYYILHKKNQAEKYKKTCDCPGHIIITAPKLRKIIPKGKYSFLILGGYS